MWPICKELSVCGGRQDTVTDLRSLRALVTSAREGEFGPELKGFSRKYFWNNREILAGMAGRRPGEMA